MLIKPLGQTFNLLKFILICFFLDKEKYLRLMNAKLWATATNHIKAFLYCSCV